MDNNKLVNSGYPALPFYVNDHGLDSLWSITIVSGAGVLAEGTVLGKITASGYYDAYADAGAGGLDTAVGILMYRVDATNGDTPASMMTHGNVRSGSLTGVTSAAIADLSPEIRFV